MAYRGVHVYTGNGKGKTTAAIGLSIRMLGHEKKVFFVQFLKSRVSGELKSLKTFSTLDALVQTKSVKKFLKSMNEEELDQTKKEIEEVWKDIQEKVLLKKYHLIVLDEVIDVMEKGFLKEEEVIHFFKENSVDSELVFTGHHPSLSIIEFADYHTIFTASKHPYQKGVLSRIGVEY